MCGLRVALGLVAIAVAAGIAPAPSSAGVAAIVLQKTVMVDDGTDTCATETAIDVAEGTTVRYCFEVTNNTSEVLDTHDLVDSELGTLLTDFPFTLNPGASAFLTQTAVIDSTTTNTATWTAENAENTYMDEAVATVTVTGPALTLVKTVMVDTGVDLCAATTTVAVPPGTTVRYCYEITNNTNQDFDTHDLVDDELGTLLDDFPYTLTPGASAFLTETATISATVTNTATWTASNKSNTYEGQATATVTVVTAPATPTPTATATATPTSTPAVGLLPDTRARGVVPVPAQTASVILGAVAATGLVFIAARAWRNGRAARRMSMDEAP